MPTAKEQARELIRQQSEHLQAVGDVLTELSQALQQHLIEVVEINARMAALVGEPGDPEPDPEPEEPTEPEDPEPPHLEPPVEPEPGLPVQVIEKGALAWRLRQAAVAGQFVTGDPWFLGSNVVEALPGFDGVKHGSVVNPKPGPAQGYDSRLGGRYTESWGLWNPELTAARQVALRPGSVLVSTVGEPDKVEKGPQLRAAEVLSCLEAAPPALAFRPPLHQPSLFDEFRAWPTADRMRLELLQAGVPLDGAPHPDDVARWFDSPWLDHLQNEASRFLHPSATMPSAYGPDLCSFVGEASLLLHTGLDLEAKLPIAIGLVQYGLDLYSLARLRPDYWYGSPHHAGKKWPIIMAALLLEEPTMLEFLRGWKSSEDFETWTVSEPRPEKGYTEEHVGLPEWGIRHSGPFAQPEQDDVRFFESDPVDVPGFVGATKPDGTPSNAVRYRTCCTTNSWLGQVLAAHLTPGAVGVWDHEPLFGYCQRYVRVMLEREASPPLVSKSRWVLRAWEALMS